MLFILAHSENCECVDSGILNTQSSYLGKHSRVRRISGMSVKDLKDKYAFVGVGVTKQGKIPEMSADELAAQAIQLALEDSGMKKKEIDGYIFQPGAGLSMVMPLARVGIPSKFHWQMQTGGATAISMIAAAIGAMEARLCRACILLYANGASNMGPPLGVGSDRPLPPQPRSTEGAYGIFGPATSAAFMARRYMHLYGLTREQLGAVAITFREYANKRPEAIMYERKMTIDDYLNARMIVEPLCLFDCCLVNDGAIALIIAPAEIARYCKKSPVYIMGFGLDHSLRELGGAPQDAFEWDGFMTQQAGDHAFNMARITLKDVDVAEMYDAFTFFYLSQLESYGICKKGEAGAFVEAGNLRLDGEWPSNTSGTELSWSYMSGFTHLTEGIRQMRGECGECQVKGAEIAMITGLGGFGVGSANTCCILRR
jgi:acetyl-CoA acetyltransferase